MRSTVQREHRQLKPFSHVHPATGAVAASGKWRAWVTAARVPTLPAAVSPILVGAAAAARGGHFRPLASLVALVSSVLIQIGTNLANDLFDFKKGADAGERLGPLRVTQAGLLSPGEVAAGTIVSFGLAALLGLYLVHVAGWPLLVVGILSIASGVLYTGGPWPLGYHGLGDLFVFIFFGLVATMGTYYVNADSLSVPALVVSIPIALLVTAILVVNNLRDIEPDRAAGKFTLAVLIGARATRLEYAVMVTVAYLMPLAMRLSGMLSNWFWLPWLSLPVAVAQVRTVMEGAEGPPLNRVLKGTGEMELLYSALLAASLLL